MSEEAPAVTVTSLLATCQVWEYPASNCSYVLNYILWTLLWALSTNWRTNCDPASKCRRTADIYCRL